MSNACGYSLNMTTPLSGSIRIEDLSKRYRDFTAVEGLNLEIRQGEFLSLLGPSGCGKTTTLRMLAGFVAPTQGHILVGGIDVSRLPPHKRNIGLVFQNYALWPHMTVYQNVAFGLKIAKQPRSVIDRKVAEVLALTSLDHLADRYPRELSGGQQQRVALARAIALDPPIILMDEPLSNLDRKLRVAMRKEIKELQRKIGTTTLYVTHDQEEALAMSDRIAIMNKGKLVRLGSPSDIYNDPRHEFVADFMGDHSVLEAIVSSVRDDLALTTTTSGLRLQVLSRGTTSIGQRVRVHVRPERIKLLNDKADEPNSIAGRIGFVEFLGAVVRYSIELEGGDTLLAETQNVGAPHAIGDRVWALIAPSDMFLFRV